MKILYRIILTLLLISCNIHRKDIFLTAGDDPGVSNRVWLTLYKDGTYQLYDEDPDRYERMGDTPEDTLILYKKDSVFKTLIRIGDHLDEVMVNPLDSECHLVTRYYIHSDSFHEVIK